MTDIDILATVNDVLDEYKLSRLTKYATTNGGSYVGPCPRCKKLTGNGGKDRLVVWPARPAYGEGSRMNPCFKCGQCRFENGRTWSGDLVQFLRDVHDWTMGEACAFLGIRANFSGEVIHKKLVPQASPTGAPSEVWQEAALQIVHEAYETLWSDAGASARTHLMEDRKLTEETLRKHVVGYLAEKRYIDGEAWGLEGKLVLPQGIVFPEYHKTRHNGSDYREIWSLAIRRSARDIRAEEKETGRKVGKYHFVRGGTKGLYNADAIVLGKPHVMLEGQVDALTVEQETCGEYAATATQGVSGARHPLWVSRVLLADVTLFCMDPDNAGRDAFTYWSGVLPAEKLFVWIPKNGDMNEMLQDGEEVSAFLLQGHDLYKRFTIAPQSKSEGDTRVDLVDIPLEISDTLTVISEPLVSISAQELPIDTDSECDDCRGWFDSSVLHALEGMLLCEKCNALRRGKKSVLRLCERCGETFTYTVEGLSFCEQDFAAFQLLSVGAKVMWEPFSYPAGKGLVSAKNGVYEEHGAGRVQGGRGNWITFALQAPRAEVWSAAYVAHCHAQGDYEKEMRRSAIRALSVPCARTPGGCIRDGKKSIRTNFTRPKNEQGWEDMRAGYLYPEEKPLAQFLGGQWLYWCPLCTDGYFVLEFGKLLHYPLFRGGVQLTSIEAGRDAWIVAVTTADVYTNTCRMDDLRRKYPEQWATLLDILDEDA